MNRVILTTGGTGGHIFPALAVAEELKDRFPEAKILFVGGNYGPEKQMARRAGLEFAALPARGVIGRGWRALAAPVWMSQSVLKAMLLMARFKPQVVIGFGGYAAFGAVMAAVLKRIPSAIHEQNSIPGQVNKLLGGWAKKVFLSFPDDSRVFPADKSVLTGNPVRRAIREAASQRKDEERTDGGRLLILGGSQGAVAINTAIMEALPALEKAGLLIRHQTGRDDYERVRPTYEQCGLNVSMVSPFIDDMAGAYSWADLVICRSGATTVAELTVSGSASLMIPFPFAAANHQYLNAKSLAKRGAAVLLEEKDIGREKPFAEVIVGLLRDRAGLDQMRAKAKELGHPQAAQSVVDGLVALVRGDSK